MNDRKSTGEKREGSTKTHDKLYAFEQNKKTLYRREGTTPSWWLATSGKRCMKQQGSCAGSPYKRGCETKGVGKKEQMGERVWKNTKNERKKWKMWGERSAMLGVHLIQLGSDVRNKQ